MQKRKTTILHTYLSIQKYAYIILERCEACSAFLLQLRYEDLVSNANGKCLTSTQKPLRQSTGIVRNQISRKSKGHESSKVQNHGVKKWHDWVRAMDFFCNFLHCSQCFSKLEPQENRDSKPFHSKLSYSKIVVVIVAVEEHNYLPVTGQPQTLSIGRSAHFSLQHLLRVRRNQHRLRRFQWPNVPADIFEFLSTEFAACLKLPSRGYCIF